MLCKNMFARRILTAVLLCAIVLNSFPNMAGAVPPPNKSISNSIAPAVEAKGVVEQALAKAKQVKASLDGDIGVSPVPLDASPESTLNTVTFKGWYVGGTKVTTAEKGQRVTAKLKLSNEPSGRYKMRIRRDIRWWPDETVEETTFYYDGGTIIKTLSFVPQYATNESNTRGYHVDLYKKRWLGWKEVWTMEDSYPPRLRVCKNCDAKDDCYPYPYPDGTGCEERDYYCSGEGVCKYNTSNRGTDYYDNWVYYCSDDTIWKHRKFHDFYCDGGKCKDHTSWKDDKLVKNCNNKDGWYNKGGSYSCCDGDGKYTCQDQEYRDYGCSEGISSCGYRVTNTRTVKSNYENCNTQDGWVDTGDTRWVDDPNDPSMEKEQKKQKYRDYTCSDGSCIYSVTDTRWVDTGRRKEKPAPEITYIKYPKSIILNEWATIRVDVTNRGGEATWQSINISFPDKPGESNVQHIADNLETRDKYGPGEEVGAGYGQYTTILDYTMVEGWTSPWASGEDKYLEIKVKPQEAGDFHFYVKSVAKSFGGSYYADPKRDGSESSERDQQDEYVEVHKIEVIPPNSPPTLKLTGPSSDITVAQGDKVTITWEDSDPDDNAFISLARDTDSDPKNGGHTWLTVSLREDPDGDGDRYIWDTSGVPLGTYYIWGMIYDTHNPEVFSVAPGKVSIEKPTKPSPKIMEVKAEITPEGKVRIKVKAKNEGEEAEWQTINISFPSNPKYVEVIGHDLDSARPYWPGEEVHAGYGTKWVELEYPMAEGTLAPWPSGEEKYLEVKVKPEKVGDFKFYVKSVAGRQPDGKVYSWDPKTGTKDQQDEYVEVHTIPVSELVFIELLMQKEEELYEAAKDLIEYKSGDGKTSYTETAMEMLAKIRGKYTNDELDNLLDAASIILSTLDLGMTGIVLETIIQVVKEIDEDAPSEEAKRVALEEWRKREEQDDEKICERLEENHRNFREWLESYASDLTPEEIEELSEVIQAQIQRMTIRKEKYEFALKHRVEIKTGEGIKEIGSIHESADDLERALEDLDQVLIWYGRLNYGLSTAFAASVLLGFVSGPPGWIITAGTIGTTLISISTERLLLKPKAREGALAIAYLMMYGLVFIDFKNVSDSYEEILNEVRQNIEERDKSVPKGELVSFDAQDAKVGEEGTFSIEFRNDGSTEIEARGIIEILSDSKTIGLVGTEAQRVSGGDTIVLEANYTLLKPGVYTAEASVLFDGKETPRSSTTFEVDSHDLELRVLTLNRYSAEPGDYVRIEASVHNNGRHTENVSADISITGPDYSFAHSVSIGTLKPNHATGIDRIYTWEIPADVKAGYYTIEVTVHSPSEDEMPANDLKITSIYVSPDDAQTYEAYVYEWREMEWNDDADYAKYGSPIKGAYGPVTYYNSHNGHSYTIAIPILEGANCNLATPLEEAEYWIYIERDDGAIIWTPVWPDRERRVRFYEYFDNNLLMVGIELIASDVIYIKVGSPTSEASLSPSYQQGNVGEELIYEVNVPYKTYGYDPKVLSASDSDQPRIYRGAEINWFRVDPEAPHDDFNVIATPPNSGTFNFAVDSAGPMTIQGDYVPSYIVFGELEVVEEGSFSGYVKDTSGSPIKAAEVTITAGPSSGSASTDLNGYYQITNLAPGIYAATASKSGYSSQDKTGIEVQAGQDTPNQNFTLTANPGSFSGYVRDGEGNPISGATVEVISGPGSGSDTTDANGYYQITNLPPGTYSARASKSGYNPQDKTGIVVNAGQDTSNQNFMLVSGPPTVPNPPSNLSATAVSKSQINLSWNDNSDNEEAFLIYRNGAYLDWVGENITTYQDTGLECGTLYSYHVTASNDAGESDPSNKASATTHPCPPTVPNPPSNLSATAVSRSQINLSWNDNSNNEDGFRIYRNGSYLTSVGANVTSYQDTGLYCGMSYSYYVTAYNSAGESSQSNTASATTYDCPPEEVPNDLCTNAIVIPSNGPFPYTNTQDTTQATTSADDPNQGCGAGVNSNSVWYTFTPDTDGFIDVETCGSDYDTVLSIFDGTCGAFGSSLACNDNACNLQSQIVGFPVSAGTTYYIEITDSGGLPGGGTLNFTLDFVEEVCQGGWSVSNVRLNGSGNSITVNPGDPVRLEYDFQVWNGTADPGSIKQVLAGLVRDSWSQVIDDCAYNGIPATCPDKTSGSFDYTFTAPTTPGTYQVVVANDAQYSCGDAKNNFPNQSSKAIVGTISVVETPSISHIIPNQGTNDVPNEINVYGLNFAEGISVTLGTTPPTSLDTTRLSSSRLRATVPAGLPAGTYDLTVTNPGGGSDTLEDAYTVFDVQVENDDLYAQSHDLWTDPLTIRQGEQASLGLVVHRQGGKTTLFNVIVRFYDGDPDNGGTPIGDGTIYLLAPNSNESTTKVPWSPAAAGDYAIYARIDPYNDISETIETNNTVSTTVTVLPPAGDTTPPVVTSFTINEGAETTDVFTVTLSVSAEDDAGGSGVGSIFFVEFEFVQAAMQWVPVQASGWLTYTTNYTWTLMPVAGVRYMQAWAADRAGNISLYSYNDRINYLPPRDQVAMGQARLYRHYVEAWQTLSVTVTPISGDPDLYIWSPEGTLAGVSNNSTGVDQLSIVADESGTYQIEVYGYSAAEYTISIGVSGGGASLAPEGQAFRSVNAEKLLPEKPVIPVSDEPPGQMAIPTAPITGDIHKIYLPVILKQAL